MSEPHLHSLTLIRGGVRRTREYAALSSGWQHFPTTIAPSTQTSATSMDMPDGSETHAQVEADSSEGAATIDEGKQEGQELDRQQDVKAANEVADSSVHNSPTAGQDGGAAEVQQEASVAGLEDTNSRTERVEQQGPAKAEPEAATEGQQTSDAGNPALPDEMAGHKRSTSKVEVIEAPNRASAPAAAPIVDTGHASPLRPDPAQHRHDSRLDHPSSYQPSAPRPYMQLRATALQLPNNTATSPNASHAEPPTIILEGRTNLSSARRSYYPKVTRTLPELHLWLLALTLSFPASIFSPLTYPLALLMDGGPTSDLAIRNYLVTVTNQLSRILAKPYVLSHPATIALVDCDFSYTPTLPHIGPGSSPLAHRRMEEGLSIARAGFDPLRGKKGKGSGLTGSTVASTWDVDGVAAALGLPTAVYATNNDNISSAPTSSKNPLSLFSRANSSPQRIQHPPPVALPPGEEDEDEEDLTLARNEITRLEMQFEKASLAASMVVEKSGALNATLNQLIQALGHLERLDAGRLIAKRCREGEVVASMIKGIEGWSAAQAGASATVLSTISPSMSYQSLNARMAIDALLRRAAAATHRHSALVVLVQKRREAERLKRARGEIRQEEVDWVLNELKEAQRTTQILTNHLATFTATLKDELKSHSRFTHSDVQTALINHARNSIRAHKHMLGSLTKARDEFLARREGKEADAVAAVGVSIKSDPMPFDVAVQEEQPVVDSKAIAEEQPGDRSSKALEAPHPSLSDQSLPTASSSSTLSRDKALPVAPNEEGDEEDGSTVAHDEGEPATASPTVLQAAVTPSPPPVESPWAQGSPVTQSGFLPPPEREQDAKVSQSAFLPGRNMERYANPFARLQAGSTVPTPGQAPALAPSEPAKTNDVWANRSRLSASDAARSLAGRF